MLYCGSRLDPSPVNRIGAVRPDRGLGGGQATAGHVGIKGLVMFRRASRSWFILTLVFFGLSCAPSGENGSPDDSAGDDREQPSKAPAPIPILAAHKDRIDAVLKHVRQRDLLTDHGFWTIFHGILGMGPNDAMLLNPVTKKRVNAVDYIASGGSIRGLEFIPKADGVEVITMPGSIIGQGHQDDFLSVLTAWDLPRDKKFLVNGRDYTFDDFIRQARAHASVTNNEELSWTIIIVSQYYGPDHRWTNNRGESLNVEDMARYELGQPIADSPVCGGTHRLFGLTWAYYLHRKAGGKKEGVWKQVADTIADYEGRARQFQNPDGSFSTRYLEGPDDVQDTQLRIASTGHILEWLALAMTDAQLRQPWVEKAADALTLMILENSFESLDGGALYHAAHGLELYRARLWGPPGSHQLRIPLPPDD
jgi:hypothetical protein